MSDDRAERWRQYYENTVGRPPRETLLAALDAFGPLDGAARLAVDLGCGGGRDTVECLRRGWRVLAVDAQPAALEAVRALATDLPGASDRLETRVARFEQTALPRCDLVNSSFALPLCPRPTFEALWARIETALTPGGRISAQLYGMRDQWAGDPSITHLNRAEVEALLVGWQVERLDEEESDSVTPRGKSKHWHVYHVVARR